MKFFRAIARIVPHLCIVFSLLTLVFFCIDRVNIAMAFMTSELSKWVFAVLAVLACASAVMLIFQQWKEGARRTRRDAKRRLKAEVAEAEAAEHAATEAEE